MTFVPTHWPSLGKFRYWLDFAEPGERYVYHYGYLARDRDWANSDGRTAIRQLANLAMGAAQTGLVHLVQRRLDDNYYEYIAERR